MAKFHINPNTGEPGKCSATKGGCPFGGAEEHFTSMEAARAVSEKQLAEANGWGGAKRGADSPEVKALKEEIAQLENNPARHFSGLPEDEQSRFVIEQAIKAKKDELKALQAKSDDPKTGYEKLNPAVKALSDEITQLENNPARNHSGFPEDEMTRYNIEKAIRDKKEELRALAPNADFLHLRNAVTNADRSYALESVANRASGSNKKLDWDSVMGAGTRRTARAIKQYQGVRSAIVSSDPAYKEEIEKLAEKHRDQELYARAFENGVAIPKEYDEAFEKTWKGSQHGEKYFRSELRSLADTKRQYANGTLSATKIVGGGLRNPKAAAEEYLKNREVELNRAIATRGRSDTVTVSNVLYSSRTPAAKARPELQAARDDLSAYGEKSDVFATWSKIHPDFKDSSGGVRKVLANGGSRGTVLAPWRGPAVLQELQAEVSDDDN